MIISEKFSFFMIINIVSNYQMILILAVSVPEVDIIEVTVMEVYIILAVSVPVVDIIEVTVMEVLERRSQLDVFMLVESLFLTNFLF